MSSPKANFEPDACSPIAVQMEPFRNKRILIVSPEAWGPMKISKHHYATVLAQEGAQVFFLSPASATAASPGAVTTDQDGLVLLTDVRHVPGQRFLPRPVRALLDAWRLHRIAEQCGGGFDLLWNFDVHRFRSLRSREHAQMRLLHIMDLPVPSQAFEPANNADLVIAVSPSMLDALDPHIAADRLHIPHGIVATRSTAAHDHIRRPGINIGYAGNLAMRYLDHNSLLYIARNLPATTLHLFGATQGAFGGRDALSAAILDQYKRTPNVVLHGPIASNQLPGMLEQMDLLLVAYDSCNYPNETRNAHKVLEYLSVGKAILASHMADVTHLQGLITMAGPERPISELVNSTLAELDTLNAPERMEARKKYAASMSYTSHLKAIGKALMHSQRYSSTVTPAQTRMPV